MIDQALYRIMPYENRHASQWRSATKRVCKSFIESGLADKKFLSELRSGEMSKAWSCISEALVYSELYDHEFIDRAYVGKGPDFLLKLNRQKVWIEVICPEPKGIPDSWTDPPATGAGNVPHTDILLRWTSALKAKAEGLLGKNFDLAEGYLHDETVSSEDPYVVAINGCRLRHGPFSSLIGISQYPVAAEVAFAIGPYQVKINRETLEGYVTVHS